MTEAIKFWIAKELVGLGFSVAIFVIAALVLGYLEFSAWRERKRLMERVRRS